MLLKNKVCLVTGTSKGIGAKTVEQFAKEGAVVYANAREEGCLDDWCELLAKEHKTEVKPVYFDVRDLAGAKKVFLKIRREQGRLDVLVNNAGVMRDAVIGMIGQELMDEIFHTNVYAVMHMIQLANKLMSWQKSGSIINLSSIVGIEGNAGQLVYSASKGAVAALTKSAAKELACHQIRVNAVAPGMIDTDMFRSIGQEKMDMHRRNMRMGRFGTVEDVANCIVFLASDLSSYISGQVLGVDGDAII